MPLSRRVSGHRDAPPRSRHIPERSLRERGLGKSRCQVLVGDRQKAPVELWRVTGDLTWTSIGPSVSPRLITENLTSRSLHTYLISHTLGVESHCSPRGLAACSSPSNQRRLPRSPRFAFTYRFSVLSPTTGAAVTAFQLQHVSLSSTLPRCEPLVVLPLALFVSHSIWGSRFALVPEPYWRGTDIISTGSSGSRSRSASWRSPNMLPALSTTRP